MDVTTRRRIAGDPKTFTPYALAEALFIEEQGMEPDDLWQLLAFLRTVQTAGELHIDSRTVEAVHALAARFQPRLRS